MSILSSPYRTLHSGTTPAFILFLCLLHYFLFSADFHSPYAFICICICGIISLFWLIFLYLLQYLPYCYFVFILLNYFPVFG